MIVNVDTFNVDFLRIKNLERQGRFRIEYSCLVIFRNCQDALCVLNFFPTLIRGFTAVDSTLLAGYITAGATVVVGIITVGVKITPRYTKRKDRRERIDRYRVEYNNWRSKVKTARKEYRAGKIVDNSELDFPKSIDYKRSGISIYNVENAASIIKSMIFPYGLEFRIGWIMDSDKDKGDSLKVIYRLALGDFCAVKDYLLEIDDYDFLSEDLRGQLYFEDEIKRFIEDPQGAVEFSVQVSDKIDAYVSQARDKYVIKKVEPDLLHRVEMVVRYKLLFESRLILSFFGTNISNYDPKNATLVDKFFLADDGVFWNFMEYVDLEYDKAEAAFLKKGKM